MDPYAILNLPRNASADDIKKAFHRLAHIYHPDKAGGDAEKFKKISAAYALLKDKAPETYGGYNPQPTSDEGWHNERVREAERAAQQAHAEMLRQQIAMHKEAIKRAFAGEGFRVKRIIMGKDGHWHVEAQ